MMEPVTCSLDNNMDDFARYIENGSKIYASEKSNIIAKKWIPEDFVFPKDHNTGLPHWLDWLENIVLFLYRLEWLEN